MVVVVEGTPRAGWGGPGSRSRATSVPIAAASAPLDVRMAAPGGRRRRESEEEVDGADGAGLQPAGVELRVHDGLPRVLGERVILP